ncbi:alpha/beta fold hydrolase [Aquabacterium sp.]|uniref:alpha/beta fold hydrolase n=1 Tax=Aquabacterium sp. TaxID=1872578 RepID=UPI0035B1D378
MNEIACQFGPGQSLIGVLTTPAQASSSTAVVLFNAGVIPRYGPHRINVKLARALAAQGRTVLRFDLSGVGDSPHQGGEKNFIEQAVRDLRSAMDHVSASTGIQRFILIGICSGAVNAYWAAQADERVAGLMMVDGFWYATRLSAWARRWKRLQVTPWSKVLGAAWRSLLRRPSSQSAQADEPALFDGGGAPANPSKADFAGAMQRLVGRGTAVFVLFTGSVLDCYSYGSQFRHAFRGQPWLPKVRAELRSDIDHTITSQASQRHFIDLIAGWLSQVDSVARQGAE